MQCDIKAPRQQERQEGRGPGGAEREGRPLEVDDGSPAEGEGQPETDTVVESNGIRLVVAAGFARIFRQNMFNCGLLALELPAERIDALFRRFAGRPGVSAVADVASGTLAVRCGGDTERIPFALGPFERALLEAGGWLEYADRRYESLRRKESP
mgnify:CR=1 FL=1